MTHDTPIRIDHVGIAVEDFNAAEAVLLALGAKKYVDDTGPNEQFRWVGYILGNASRLELITPLTEDNFLRDYLDAHGPGLHHVTLEVVDIDAVTEALNAAGVRVIDRADYEIYSEVFVSPRNPTGTLFQLMQYHEPYTETYDEARSFIGGRRLGEAQSGAETTD